MARNPIVELPKFGGNPFLAILLGPEAACLSVSVTLILQALLFGDGGILAIGANCFNMAFVLPFVGYAVYSLLSKKLKSKGTKYLAAGIAGYVGINAAALCTAVEFGVQPLLFKGADGQALYCPYGLNVSVPAMMAEHLTLFGLAEAIFTVAMLAFFEATSPEIMKNQPRTKKGNTLIGVLLGVLTCATPIGLLATGTAWGEWGADEIAELAGYTPKGLKSGILSGFEAICPDYSIGSLPEWIGYILCAIIGIAICTIMFKLISTFMKSRVSYD